LPIKAVLKTDYLKNLMLKTNNCMLKTKNRKANIAKSTIMNLAIVLAIAVLPSGCGYQLQKPLSIENAEQPVYVDGDLLLALALKRQLALNNISTSKNPSNAGSVVSVALIDDDSRSYSISLDGRNAEVLRTMKASIEWRSVDSKKTNSSDSRELLPRSVVSTEQVQIQNPDNVTAQTREAESIGKEMRETLVEKMLNLMRYRSQSK
jgi:outer membrane lipopolysaccharide assembly protein LptE/RlpB